MITKLLSIRRNCMAVHHLEDPLGDRYLFTDKDREGVMHVWKQRFHNSADQIDLQMRDSWKPSPKDTAQERRNAEDGRRAKALCLGE